jgi:hypothetical protein
MAWQRLGEQRREIQVPDVDAQPASLGWPRSEFAQPSEIPPVIAELRDPRPGRGLNNVPDYRFVVD